MLEVRQTRAFHNWHRSLKDRVAQKRIAARIDQLAHGLFGDVKPVGEGVSELRLHFGPGYRLYFVRRGAQLIVLLCGGDKSSQDRDIAAAHAMARELE